MNALVEAGIPPWIFPVIMVVAIWILVEIVKKSAPGGKARGLVVRASIAEPADRDRMEQQALTLVHDDPHGLLVVAQEALNRGRAGLARAATARLKALGKRPEDVRRLEAVLEGDRGRPERELVAVRNLWEEGLEPQALERLARARTAWPDDEALADLEAELKKTVIPQPGSLG